MDKIIENSINKYDHYIITSKDALTALGKDPHDKINRDALSALLLSKGFRQTRLEYNGHRKYCYIIAVNEARLSLQSPEWCEVNLQIQTGKKRCFACNQFIKNQNHG